MNESWIDKAGTKRTLRTADEPLYSSNDLVPVAIGVDANLLQLPVAHLHKHVQGYLHTGEESRL